MRARTAFTLAALAIAAPACSTTLQEDVTTTTPADVRPVDPKRVAGPFVQAGTVFAIELDEAIDTERTQPGQPFTAHTLEAIAAPDGRVIVRAGARVRGRVASTGNLAHPRLGLELDAVETTAGPARVSAIVLRAQRFTYPGEVSMSPVGRPEFADDYTYSYADGTYGTANSSRGPAPGAAYERVYPREIRMPRGARISLELTQPILPPGTGLRR